MADVVTATVTVTLEYDTEEEEVVIWLSADEDKSVTDGDRVFPGVAAVVVSVDDNRGVFDVDTENTEEDTEEEEEEEVTWLSAKKQTNIEYKLKK